MKAFTLFLLSSIVYNVSSTRIYDELCKSRRNGEFLRHSLDCHKFIRCSHGKAFEFQCPVNLLWHHEIKTCDYAYRTSCDGGGMVTGVLTNKELSLGNKFKKTRKKLKEINDKNVKIFSTKKPKVTVTGSLPLNVKNITHSMLITSNVKRKEGENGNDDLSDYSDRNYTKLFSYSWQPQQLLTNPVILTFKENSTFKIAHKENESLQNSSNTNKNENPLSVFKLKEKFTKKSEKKDKNLKGTLSEQKEKLKQNLTADHTVKLTEENREMLKENMTTESSFTETLMTNITNINLTTVSANKITKLELETTTLNTELNIETFTTENVITDLILADDKLTKNLLRKNRSTEDNFVKDILTDLPQIEIVNSNVKITELENAQLISTTEIPSVNTTEDTTTVNNNFYNSTDYLKEITILKKGITTESFEEINKESCTSVIENSKDSVTVTDKITEEDYNIFQTTEITKQPFIVKITEEEHNSFQTAQSFTESKAVDNKATTPFVQNISKSLIKALTTITESSAAFNSSSFELTEESYNLHNSSESFNKNKDSTSDIFKYISQSSPVILLSFNSSVGLTSTTGIKALQDKFNYHNSTESSTSLEEVSQAFRDHTDGFDNSNELKDISNSTAWETEVNISNDTLYTQNSTELHFNSFDKTTEHFRKTTESSRENISSTNLGNQTPSKEVLQTSLKEDIQTLSKELIQTSTENFNSSAKLTVTSADKITEKEFNISTSTESLIENATKSYIENISKTISKEENSTKEALETFTENFNSTTKLTVTSVVKKPKKELNISTESLLENTTKNYIENINNTISKEEISSKEALETFKESFNNSTQLTQTSTVKRTEKELNIANITDNLIELTTEIFKENINNTSSKKVNSTKEALDTFPESFHNYTKLTQTPTVKITEKVLHTSTTTENFIKHTTESYKAEISSQLSEKFTVQITENELNLSDTTSSIKDNGNLTLIEESTEEISNEILTERPQSFIDKVESFNISTLLADLTENSPISTVTIEDFRDFSTDKTTENDLDLKSSTESSKKIDTSSSFLELNTHSGLIENSPGFAEGFALVIENSFQFSKTTHDFARDTMENEENYHDTLGNSNEIIKSFTATIENTERIMAEAYEDVPDIMVTVNENSVNNTEEYSKFSTTESSTETKENIKYNFTTYKEDFKETSLVAEIFNSRPNEVNTSDNLEESYEVVSTSTENVDEEQNLVVSTENSIENNFTSTQVNSKQNLAETAKAFTEIITTATETFTYTTTELEKTLSDSTESSFENQYSSNLKETNTKESLNHLPANSTKTSDKPVDFFNMSEEYRTEITENKYEFTNITENFNENLSINTFETQNDTAISKESFYESFVAVTEILKLKTTESSPDSKNNTETLTQIQSSTVSEVTNETFKEALENITQSEAIPPKVFNSSNDLKETNAVDSVVQENKEIVLDNEDLESFSSSNEILEVTYSSEESIFTKLSPTITEENFAINSFNSEEDVTEMDDENTNTLESNSNKNVFTTVNEGPATDFLDLNNPIKTTKESSLASFANSEEVLITKSFEIEGENTNSVESNSNENAYTRVSKNPALFATDTSDNLHLFSPTKSITTKLPSTITKEISSEVFGAKTTGKEGESTNNPKTNSKENVYTTVYNNLVTFATDSLDNTELHSLINNLNTDSKLQASENFTSPEEYSFNSFPTTDTYADNTTENVNLIDSLEELITESIIIKILQNSNNSLNFLDNTTEDFNTKVSTDFNVNLTERETNVSDFDYVTKSYDSWTNNFASVTSNPFTSETTKSSETFSTTQDLTTEFNPDSTTQDPRLPFRSPECRGANNRRQFKALKCFQYYQCFAGWAFLLNCHEGWWFAIEEGQCVLDVNKKCEL